MIILKKLFSYILVFVCSLVIVEFISSKLDREEVLVNGYDNEYIYSFYPNTTGIQISTEYETTVTIDDISLKNCYHNIKKKSNHKLWIIGNHFSEGSGINCEKSFSFLIEDFKTYNGGLDKGSLPTYILKNRHYIKEIQPDLMIMQISDEDIGESYNLLSYLSLKDNKEIEHLKKTNMILNFFKKEIQEKTIYRTLSRSWYFFHKNYQPIEYYKPLRSPKFKILNSFENSEIFGRFTYIDDLENYKNGTLEFYRFKNLKNISKNKKWKERFIQFEVLLKQLIKEAREIQPSIKIYLLYIPTKEIFAKGGIEGKIRSKTDDIVSPTLRQIYSNSPIYQFLKQFSKMFRIPLINTIPVLNRSPFDFFYLNSPYLNEKGHKVVANLINRTLTKEK